MRRVVLPKFARCLADGGGIDWSNHEDAACLAAVADELLIYLPRAEEGLRQALTAATSALLRQADALRAPSWLTVATTSNG